MSVRHKAREAALRLLYQIDASGDSSAQARADFWSAHGNNMREPDVTFPVTEREEEEP